MSYTEQDFRDRFMDAVDDKVDSKTSENGLKPIVQEFLDNGLFHTIAELLSDLKTNFERDQYNKYPKAECSERSKAFANRVGYCCNTQAKAHGVRFYPIKRPRGDKVFDERWEYVVQDLPVKVEDAVPAEEDIPPTTITPEIPSVDSMIADDVRNSPESAVRAVLRYHDKEAVGKAFVQILKEKEVKYVEEAT